MKYLLYFMLCTFIFLCAWGCGEDNDLQDQKELRIISVVPNGGEIASNASITLTFNKKVSSVTVMINGNQIPVHTSADGKTCTFNLSSLSLLGDLILTVDAEDETGQRLTGFEPIKFRVVGG